MLTATTGSLECLRLAGAHPVLALTAVVAGALPPRTAGRVDSVEDGTPHELGKKLAKTLGVRLDDTDHRGCVEPDVFASVAPRRVLESPGVHGDHALVG